MFLRDRRANDVRSNIILKSYVERVIHRSRALAEKLLMIDFSDHRLSPKLQKQMETMSRI